MTITEERLDELSAQCSDPSVSGMLIDARELAQLILWFRDGQEVCAKAAERIAAPYANLCGRDAEGDAFYQGAMKAATAIRALSPGTADAGKGEGA